MSHQETQLSKRFLLSRKAVTSNAMMQATTTVVRSGMYESLTRLMQATSGHVTDPAEVGQLAQRFNRHLRIAKELGLPDVLKACPLAETFPYWEASAQRATILNLLKVFEG